YRIFKKGKYDIVQYSTPNAALYASLASRMAEVPVRVYGQWGIRYVGFNGIKRRIFRLLEKITCFNSTHIRSVSRLNRQFGIDEGLYPESKVKVIGNGGTIGVDLNDYKIENKEVWKNEVRNVLKIPADAFVYCFCGRVSADKGSSELIQAFRSLAERHPEAHLMLIGGIERNHGINEDLISWAQNNKNVHFCGRVKMDQITHYYSAADVLVHPTYREGFGMVIQEAGAMGIPVITTRIPGAGEVMEEGVSCLLVSPRNTDMLSQAMLRLIEAPEFVKEMGQSAYDRTSKLYSRPIMLANQMEDYSDLFQQAYAK
ncbi:MAG: glycosyltransferase, partial [Muribaculaceae bacterium]|nr:glycosyltransferase [Muribaculaceae bacterium]